MALFEPLLLAPIASFVAAIVSRLASRVIEGQVTRHGALLDRLRGELAETMGADTSTSPASVKAAAEVLNQLEDVIIEDPAAALPIVREALAAPAIQANDG